MPRAPRRKPSARDAKPTGYQLPRLCTGTAHPPFRSLSPGLTLYVLMQVRKVREKGGGKPPRPFIYPTAFAFPISLFFIFFFVCFLPMVPVVACNASTDLFVTACTAQRTSESEARNPGAGASWERGLFSCVCPSLISSSPPACCSSPSTPVQQPPAKSEHAQERERMC